MIPSEVYAIASGLDIENEHEPCEEAIALAWQIYRSMIKAGWVFTNDGPKG